MLDSGNQNVTLRCIDKSVEALKVVEDCARKFALAERISISQEDIFVPEWKLDKKYGLLVSEGCASCYLRGIALTRILETYLDGIEDDGVLVVDICYPDTKRTANFYA